jgi:hypothetical protein
LEAAILELLAFVLSAKLDYWPSFYDKLGAFGFALSLLPFCLAFALAASVAPVLRSQLRAVFGLDPRQAGTRLWSLFKKGASFFLYFWLASWAVYEALLSRNLVLLGVIVLAVVWGFIFLSSFLERLILRHSLRDIADDEVPEGLNKLLKAWQKEHPGKIMVSNLFGVGLRPPFPSGGDVIVSEKALVAFIPEALKSYLVMAMMGQLLKLDRNFLLLRLMTMSLCLPFGFMMLNSLGIFLGYPMTISPANLVLLWLGVWLALKFSDGTLKFLKRYIYHKLNSAVVAVTHNLTGLISAIETMARYNQAAWQSPWWRTFTLEWPSPEDQLKKLRQEAFKKEFADKQGDLFKQSPSKEK